MRWYDQIAEVVPFDAESFDRAFCVSTFYSDSAGLSHQVVLRYCGFERKYVFGGVIDQKWKL